MLIKSFCLPSMTRKPLMSNPLCSTSKKALRLPSPSNRTIRLMVIVPSVPALGRVSSPALQAPQSAVLHVPNPTRLHSFHTEVLEYRKCDIGLHCRIHHSHNRLQHLFDCSSSSPSSVRGYSTMAIRCSSC